MSIVLERPQNDAPAKQTPAAAHGAAPGVAQRIEEVPGVGPALAQRIKDHFGGDEPLQDAIRRQDVGAIAAIEGVGPKRARRIILGAQGAPDPNDFLATEAAARLWDDIVAKAQAYCGTPMGRDRVALRTICTTPEEAAARARETLVWKQRVADWDRPTLHNALARLRPLSEPRPARSMEHAVVCDPDTMQDLEARGLDRWVSLSGPEALRNPDGLLLVVGEVPGADEVPGAVPVAANAGPAELAPESILAWFRHNRTTLEALDDALRATGQEPLARAALEALPGPPEKGKAIGPIVEAAYVHLQARIRERVQKLALTGDDLLATFDDRLPAPVVAVVREEIDAAHKALHESTGVRIAVFTPARPVALDEEALQEAVHRQEEHAARRRHQQLAAAARTLQPLKARIEAAHAQILAWEADQAWACMALDLDLHEAQWSDALALHGALHLDLPRDGTAQPVDYRLGGPDPVALLTGANSGGKTTLLETLAQTMVLARFGLPVPAHEATLPWIDALHLVTHRRSLDAGAFEGFLRRFLPLASPGPRRMVLADEVEAITELQAAARILGYFLARLASNGHLGLFVTHMAPMLLESGAVVRVDGIQSTGLDADGHLIVDRVPRMGFLATSTPELIIERIARTDPDGPWQELLAVVRSDMPK